MLPKQNHSSTILANFYTESNQKIFKNYIWPGKPPISHHSKCCISNSYFQSQHQSKPYPQDIDKVLPSCIYDQVSPQISYQPQLIHHPHSYPYTAIGMVIYRVGGLMRYCTGALIESNLVLTSRTCVYDQQSAEQIKDLWFVPAYGCIEQKCREKSKYRQVRVIKTHFNPCWDGNLYGQQIALLQLQMSLSKQYGYFGILFDMEPYFSQNKQQMNKSKCLIYLCGYPYINHTIKYLYRSSTTIEQIVRNPGSRKQNGQMIDKQNEIQLLRYKIYSAYGQIGGPIFIQDNSNSQYYIIGVHFGRQPTNTVSQFKIALRLNQTIRILLNQWVRRKYGVLDICKYYKKQGKILNENQFESICTAQLPNLIGLILSFQKIGSRLKVIRENKWKKITWLQLWDNHIGTEAIKYLVKCNWLQMSRLSLSQNLIQCEGIKYLTKGYWPNLSVLSISSNILNNEAVQYMSQANWPKLTILALANNYISQVSIHNFSKCSQNLKNLSWLELHGNRRLKFQIHSRQAGGQHQFQQIDIIDTIRSIFNKIYIYV